MRACLHMGAETRGGCAVKADDGYTLAEMLTALVILGLAMAGLVEGMNVIQRTQASATSRLTQATGLTQADRRLDKLFQNKGPFRSDDAPGLVGDPAAFQFPCHGGERCGANLVTQGAKPLLVISGETGRRDTVALTGVRRPRFAYIGETAQVGQWPPPGQRARQSLRAVVIVAGSDQAPETIAAARVWLEQSAGCANNSILDDCRARPQ